MTQMTFNFDAAYERSVLFKIVRKINNALILMADTPSSVNTTYHHEHDKSTRIQATADWRNPDARAKREYRINSMAWLMYEKFDGKVGWPRGEHQYTMKGPCT